MDDFDIFACYRGLWKTELEKWNAVRQGIIHRDGSNENCMKLQINASDKDATNKGDDATAKAYGNEFIIPLNFEMLDSAMPYYQSGLGNRLCYEITFNVYDRVLTSSAPKPDAKYKITDVSLEYEIVYQPDLVRLIAMKYQSMALPYNRILRDRFQCISHIRHGLVI